MHNDNECGPSYEGWTAAPLPSFSKVSLLLHLNSHMNTIHDASKEMICTIIIYNITLTMMEA